MTKTVAYSLVLWLAGCGAGTPPPASRVTVPAMGDLGDNHPLRGRIWDVRTSTFIDQPTLFSRLEPFPFVLLGEKHDNPRHHEIQAAVLQGLVQLGRRPAVAWEMIDSDQQPVLTQFLESRPAEADRLGAAVEWEERGWPPWRFYRPIAEVALQAHLPLVAAGIDRQALMKAVHEGGANPTSVKAPPLPAAPLPAAPLPAPAVADLSQEIRESHCGHASPQMTSIMVVAQQMRDAHLARQMLGQEDGTVLIAGNGHVRQDRGVPFHLRAMLRPEPRVVSLGILEVQHNATNPRTYAEGVQGLGPAFDYVWFTRRVNNEDPCAKFKEKLSHVRHGR